MHQATKNTSIPMILQEDSWQRILSQSTLSKESLLKFLNLKSHPLLDEKEPNFPLRIPTPFLDKIRPGDLADPLLLQVLPQKNEYIVSEGFLDEPLQEQEYSPVPGLIHKYESRVLLVTTQACAIHCRYCFRRNFPYQEHAQSRSSWDSALDYIESQPKVNEVILSGGDPLSLTDKSLCQLLKKIESIQTIKRVRIHTRMLPCLPQRVTPALCSLLEGLHLKVVVVAHCNHPNELANDTAQAFKQLKNSGVSLLNQSVLLKSINNEAETLSDLSEKLFEQGVLPYYLFVLDKVNGAAHFDLPRSEAKSIHKILQSKLPGFLVPKLAEEKPGKKNKTLLQSA